MSGRVPADALTAFIVEALCSYEMPHEDADFVAHGLVEADLMGLDSHGIAHFLDHPAYIPGIESGMVNVRPAMVITDLAPSLALLDGDRGMGIIALERAFLAIQSKCSTTGIGVAWVKNSFHAGALAHFTRKGALAGCLTFAATNTMPSMAPTYGRIAALGTNPISIGVPYKSTRVLLLDMATSVVAAGKLEIAQRHGDEIPKGWIIDRDGHDSTHPGDFFNGGALLPLGSAPELGSYKGYGLGVMVDVMTGLLSGMGHGLSLSLESGHAHVIACLDMNRFHSVTDFEGGMQRMIDDLHHIPSMPGRGVWVPGEREWTTYEDRVEHGIPIEPGIMRSLVRYAEGRQLPQSIAILSAYL